MTLGEIWGSDVRILPHPRYKNPMQCLINGSNIVELQKLDDQGRSSLLIGESVSSNGTLYVATAIDPCLLLLPSLQNSKHYVPLDQLVQRSSTCQLRELLLLGVATPKSLERLCDVRDLGDGELFFRVNTTKVIRWLEVKVFRVAQSISLMANREETMQKQRQQGFVNGFTLGGECVHNCSSGDKIQSNTIASSSIRECILLEAIDFVCEYLVDDIADQLRERFGFVQENRSSERKRKPEPEISVAAKTVSWTIRSDIDAMSELAFGILKKPKKNVAANVKTAKRGNKRLLLSNKTGMKTMDLFFSKTKKK